MPVTPHPALEPHPQPMFGREQAAHLLSRAGFGGTRSEIQDAAAMGLAAAVDRLLTFPDRPAGQTGSDVPDLSPAAPYPSRFDVLAERFAGVGEREARIKRGEMIDAHRAALLNVMHWWLNRMAYGAHPLQEKLTLFWHGHFTTSSYDIWSAPMLWRQNELLRRYAAGKFSEMLPAICRDPAMLQYLDNATSHRDAPNENFARELLELFTVGLGHYSEDDIRAIARAFTGWSHDGEKFVFRMDSHDVGEKTIFSRTGRFGGDDVVTLILRQRTCPRFIATKLWEYFVGPVNDPALADSLGEALAGAGYDVRSLLRTIFTGRGFYDRAFMQNQIKSPVQLMAGTIRLLQLPTPPIAPLKEHLAAMGQIPFLPPDVKGWPGGRLWINTNTLFCRQNATAWLAGMLPPTTEQSPPWPQQVDCWVDRLIGRPIAPEKRDVLLTVDPSATHRLVQLILALPEYQLG